VHHYHDSYVIERFATIKKGLRVPAQRDLVVGQGATIVGPIQAGANVFLAKNAIVRGSIETPFDVVVGSLARVQGDVRAANVLLLEGARVKGRVQATGRVRVIGAHVEGPIEAGGDVEVRGDAASQAIHAGGRVRSLAASEADA
jgi:predicted acyltransferase (DUF342 family)